MSWFLTLKSLHVLSAITAVGANFTYAVWGIRGQRDPEHRLFALRGVLFIDSWIANPAYGVLLVTGLLMAIFYYSITTTFVVIGLGIYVLVAVIGVAVASPGLKRRIVALERGTGDDEAGIAAGVGMFLLALVIAAVFVMVFKPGL
ncbi:MAG: DUF2269 family protein [Candidatus Dormibacteria bacterium]